MVLSARSGVRRTTAGIRREEESGPGECCGEGVDREGVSSAYRWPAVPWSNIAATPRHLSPIDGPAGWWRARARGFGLSGWVVGSKGVASMIGRCGCSWGPQRRGLVAVPSLSSVGCPVCTSRSCCSRSLNLRGGKSVGRLMGDGSRVFAGDRGCCFSVRSGRSALPGRARRALAFGGAVWFLLRSDARRPYRNCGAP